MKFLKQHFSELIVCAFEIIAGILLLIRPVGFTALIITVGGIILCVIGLLSVIRYFRTDAQTAVKGQALFKGSLLIIAGLFCAIKSEWFTATFPLMTVVYGVAVLLAALMKLQTTVNLIRLKNDKWYVCGIAALVFAVCAVVILSNPFATTAVLWMFTGIALIVEAFVDIVSILVNTKSNEVR